MFIHPIKAILLLFPNIIDRTRALSCIEKRKEYIYELSIGLFPANRASFNQKIFLGIKKAILATLVCII